MNYKAFTLIFFVLIFCLSSTMSSRRLLSGSGGNKMETQPHHPNPDKSATEQPRRGRITYRALQRQPPCKEKVYANCISYPSTVYNRSCSYGNRCRP